MGIESGCAIPNLRPAGWGAGVGREGLDYMHMCMYAHQRVMAHKTREGRMYKPHRNPPNAKTHTCPHDTNPKEAARQFNISTTWVTSCGRNGCCWCTASTYNKKTYGITAPSPLWRISTNCCTNWYKLLYKLYTPLLRFVTCCKWYIKN